MDVPFSKTDFACARRVEDLRSGSTPWSNSVLPFFVRLWQISCEPVRPMKKLAILVFGLCAMVCSQPAAKADGLSWGIPLPFPFLFYNFGSGHCKSCENGYSKDNGYSKESGYSGHKCCGVPWWLQYRIDDDCCGCCGTRRRQTTAMPGVGGPQP